MSLRALIFDVDGTLADTEEVHRCAFNAAFREHGLSWHWGRHVYADLLRVTGGKERIAHFVEHSGGSGQGVARIAELHAAKTRHFARMIADGGTGLRPGVRELIQEARDADLTLAVATTTTRTNVEALLAGTLGPDATAVFALIAAGDVVARKKPAPDVYRHVLETLRLDARDCIAFEDSQNGLAAAKAAGLYTVVTPTPWTVAEDHAGADWLGESVAAAGGLEVIRRRHEAWLERTPAAGGRCQS